MEEEAKFVINFPNSNFNYTFQNRNFEFDITKEKIPVVLLFGWTGCQDRHLAKYSKIYEDKGLITLRRTTPLADLFWKKTQMVAVGEKIIDTMVDLKLADNPIIVHCFSNGGAFMYQNFIIALDKTSKPLGVQGVIFDSAPGRITLPILFGLFSTLLGEKPSYNTLFAALMATTIAVLKQFEGFFSKIFSIKAPLFDPLITLQSEKNKWPQHFIYSKEDRLIPHSDVSFFANYRKSVGVPVTSLCYENSAHVEHYLRHKESYVDSVYGFLNKCLKKLKK